MMEFFETITDFFSDLFHAIRSAVKKAGKGITRFFQSIKKKGRPSRFHLRDFNIYRRFRESLINVYLKRTVTFDKQKSIITWQPLLFVLIKLAVAAIVSYLFFSLYPYLAGYMKEGIIFFRLHEIYNFDFPTTTFLENLAKIILLIILGYIGIFYLKYQFEALLSALVISTSDKRVYYIKNSFLLKELYIFSIPGIDHVVLKQNILTRLLGIGTILLQKKSGEKVIIASIANASKVCTQLTSIIGPDSRRARE